VPLTVGFQSAEMIRYGVVIIELGVRYLVLQDPPYAPGLSQHVRIPAVRTPSSNAAVLNSEPELC
jgi:hypothetical protein